MSQEPVTLLEYGRVLWRARWWIVGLSVFSAVAAYGFGKMQPKAYVATATMLAPRESGSPQLSTGAILLGAGGGDSGRGGGGGVALPAIQTMLPSLTTNEDIFVALFKSRTLRGRVLEQLEKKWGGQGRALIGDVATDNRQKGVIRVTVEAGDPNLAAEAANEYFEQLDQMLGRNDQERSRRQENFLVSQLERAAKEVDTAEQALLKFQSENRVLGMDAPTKGAVDSVAYLRASIMTLEMQREVLRTRFTEQHPQMREIDKQITELKRQYSKNLFGEPMDLPPESGRARGPRKEFFVSAAKMTPVQFSYLKLYRNLTIQEAFYAAALQGLEQIKYQPAARATVEVLDPALPPSGPSRPNIRFIVIAGGLSGMLIGVLLAFVADYVRRLRDQERRQSMDGSARGISGLATSPATIASPGTDGRRGAAAGQPRPAGDKPPSRSASV